MGTEKYLLRGYTMSYRNERSIEVLVGQTIISIKQQGDTDLYFLTTEGKSYHMYHSQDCCETVYLQDVAGDYNDLIGSPVVSAYESDSKGRDEHLPEWGKDMTTESIPSIESLKAKDDDFYEEDSTTWTFYRISTIKGTVVLRWYGSSKGYYSEDVTFAEIGAQEIVDAISK
jgi:hypothetical protein